MNRRAAVGALVLAVLGACASLSAQSRAAHCVTSGLASSLLHRHALVLATSSDAQIVANRTRYLLSATTADSVALVSDEAICQRAAQAYARAAGDADTLNVAPVGVVRYGDSRYLVSDLTPIVGEFAVVGVFDASWALLATFAR